MSDDLRRRLEAHWAEVRAALAEYRVDDLRRLLRAPAEMPTPPRGAALDFLQQLPDLAKSRFLKLVEERGRAGYVARTHLEKGGTTLTILRFEKDGADWRLVPAPETLSSFEMDAELDDAAVADEVATQPVLKLFPPTEMTDAPPPPAPTEPPDERPEAEIRKDLEALWKAERVRLPELARTRFVKLVWSAAKPHLVGYCAETNLGDAKATTVTMAVFLRENGAWRFEGGPAAVEVVHLPPTAHARLAAAVDAHPRLKL
jgi:hypothetical protein